MSVLSINEVEKIAIQNEPHILSDKQEKVIQESFIFLKEYSRNKIIYGINTGFGPMAQFKIEDSNLVKLQYNLIRSHSSGLGKPLSEEYARSVVLARINAFLQGKSGISFAAVTTLNELLNKNITPEIYEHGGVGASGDLVQLAHLALNLIGEGYVYYKGDRMTAESAFKLNKIAPLSIKLRDGLGLINGTSCMTGIGIINQIYANRLLNWSVVASSMINEIVESFDDSFSEELNTSKLHKGQQEVAQKMRSFLKGSQLIKNRLHHFEQDQNKKDQKFKKKVQEYYSIRCVPQILGPVLDTLNYSQEVLENELNSTNDNPIIDIKNQNVFHGGNFHGDYVALEMDKMKMAITKLSMLAERQLNYLLNPSLNEKFPAFLNRGKLGFNFGVQGMQFTATSTTAESQTLSYPSYINSIPNNNDNQDIVSMGTNGALITKTVIHNGFQVLSILIMSICQAIDLLDKEDQAKISSKGLDVYKNIRNIANSIEEDYPQNENIQKVINFLKNNNAEI